MGYVLNCQHLIAAVNCFEARHVGSADRQEWILLLGDKVLIVVLELFGECVLNNAAHALKFTL